MQKVVNPVLYCSKKMVYLIKKPIVTVVADVLLIMVVKEVNKALSLILFVD